VRLPAVLVLVANAVLAVAQSQPVTQPAADTPVPVRLTPEAALALAEKKVPAAYPEKARASGIQGNVVLKVLIAETGEVKEITVISGDPELAQAAIEAIKQWKYTPYIVEGKPTLVDTQVTFGFHIKPPPPPPPLGRFHDGLYQNEFFGISYPLSAEWVRETSLMRKQLASEAGASSSTQVLLAALHVPPQSEGLVADSSLTLMAAPQLGDARDYLAAVATALIAKKMAKTRGEITPLTVAGLTVYRADFKPSGRSQYQSVLCATVKGYMLRWNVLAVSESALDEVVASVLATNKLDPLIAASTPAKSPASSDGPLSEPHHVPSGVTMGLLFKKVEPRYPEVARQERIQGTVILHAVIDKSGNVIDLEAVSGPVELVPPTVNAVRQWKYKPYQVQGEPIEVDSTIEVKYTLGG